MTYSYDRTRVASFVHTKSPGRGERLDGKGQKRLQLLDRSAPPAEPKHYHFYRRELVKKRTAPRGGKPSRLLKRPKRVTLDPGADDGVVGYVDYGHYGGDTISIALVVVRDDYRNRGIGKKLLAKLYATSGLKYVEFGRVLNPTAWKLLQWAIKEYPEVNTTGGKFFQS